LKVFLSWSGENSKLAALALHGWLPTVLQTIKPYMSAEDIEKGDRWSLNLAKELEETNFGIICMTPDNLEAPWIFFEAGALSKSIDRARVAPVMFEVAATALAGSPLLSFQYTLFKKDDFGKLIQTINASANEMERLNSDVVSKSFDRGWADLEKDIAKIEFLTGQHSKRPRHRTDVSTLENVEKSLEEILNLTRSQAKLLRSPEDLLPIQYLAQVLDQEILRRLPPDHRVWQDLDSVIARFAMALDKLPDRSEVQIEFATLGNEINHALRFIRERLFRRSRFSWVPARNTVRGATPTSSLREGMDIKAEDESS
jgi:hypothetical protein